MDFTFATAGRIRFGAEAAKELPEIASGYGSRVFVVAGGNPDRYRHVWQPLTPFAVATVSGEPSFDVAAELVEQARGADVVVAIGGGAVIDAAKCVGILLRSDRPAIDHAEVIGAGVPLPSESVPVIAVPTTAGTGSEVTANGVLTSTEHQVKVSLRSSAMLPRVALIDPTLAHTCPPRVTADSGLDALTQCIEAYVTPFATPISDAFAALGIEAAGRSLAAAYEDGSDERAREDMALAALCGGVALANAKLGVVHGFAGPLGGMIGAGHGALCGALLAAGCQVNIEALERDGGDLSRYRRMAEILNLADERALIDWLISLRERLQVVGLSQLGLARKQWDQAVESAARSSSMKGNPIKLSDARLVEVLERAS